jgi:hypothetical protein
MSGGAMSAEAGPFLVRNATDSDIEAIVGFEIDIAVVSFADEAITDPALHRRRVTGALGKPGEVTLVAVAAGAPDVVLGWGWLSARTNSLPARPQLGELLLAEVLAAADAAGLSQLTGKVHAANLGMRALYRKFGFTATHLTMERRPGDAQP